MNSFKKIINYSDLNVLDFQLPEYCEMFISGKCVTPAQAKEIIFKTDKIIEEIYKHSYCQKNKELSFWEKTLKMPLEAGCVLEDEFRAKVHNWMQQWGYKQLLVIDQSLFSSKPFVGSYSYFCAPSGIIKNKQKIETYEGFLKNVYYDCQTLSQEFPFLNMTISVTQFHKSLINFFIENGNVRVDFGNKEYFYEYQFKKETTSNQIEEFSTLLSPDLIKTLYLL